MFIVWAVGELSAFAIPVLNILSRFGHMVSNIDSYSKFTELCMLHGYFSIVVSMLSQFTISLTLAGTSHFAILHGTRGGLVRPPPTRLAPN